MRHRHPQAAGLIHLNNAAGALPGSRVLDAIAAHLELEAQIGNTEAMMAVADRLNGLYADIAELTGVSADRVAVGSSNTQIWHAAFSGLALKPGDRILVAETEWGGNLSAIAHRCRRTGARMEVVPSDATGAVDVAALGRMLDDKVRVVCVTWVPAVNGLINDVHAIAGAMAQSDAWLFVDAAQAFGQVAVDLSHPRFDVVTVSARKYLRGPRGTGFGVFSDRFLDAVDPVAADQFSAPWVGDGPQLRRDARKFEYGEAPYAVRLGLAEAVAEARDEDWGRIARGIGALAAHARARLSECPGVGVQDAGAALSGIVTFSLDEHAPAAMVGALQKAHINLSAPAAPYGPLWFAAGRAPIARMSPHLFNTEAEIDRAVQAIGAFLRRDG